MNVGLAFDAPLKECANHLYQEIIYEEPTLPARWRAKRTQLVVQTGPHRCRLCCVDHVIVLSTVALGFAGEILVGHLIGAGELRQALRLVRKCLFWGLATSTTIAVLTALTAPWTLRLFTNDPVIIANATTLLWITVLLEPGRTSNIVIMGFGSWLLGVYLDWGLVGVWFAYALDECVRGGIMAARWFGLGWVKQAVASRRLVNRSAA